MTRHGLALTQSSVKKLNQPLPAGTQRDLDSRTAEIKAALAAIEADVQGINRHRYHNQLRCLEEFVEALSFAHYLRHQTLISPEAAQSALPADILLTPHDYAFGVFDLFGEMMRFATVTAAHAGELAGSGGRGQAEQGRKREGGGDGDGDGYGEADAESPKASNGDDGRRTILMDIQDLSSWFETLPPQGDKFYRGKMEAMRNSVRKVERLGYGLVVRGTERPKGWVPDMKDEVNVDMDD